MTRNNSKSTGKQGKKKTSLALVAPKQTSVTKKFRGFDNRPEKLFVVRRGEELNELLFDLLACATPNGEEQRLYHLFPDTHHRRIDGLGNILYFVGSSKKHNTMFSCHLDTVHRNPDTIIPLVDEEGFIWGSTMKKTTDDEWHAGSILGADDKVGCYIMLRMLEQKIPGIYVFHVGEECGGIGSIHLSTKEAALFENINRCIAFDRKGYNSIITQQGDICCSDEFADALAGQLNKLVPEASAFEKDNTGTFTDSANYTNLIEECTNLSVGYWNQHGPKEHFDPLWLEKIFIPAVLKVRWSSLPTVRKKGSSRFDNAVGSQCVKGSKRTWNHNKNSTNKNFDVSYVNRSTARVRIPPLTMHFLDQISVNEGNIMAVDVMVEKEISSSGVRNVIHVIEKLLKERDALTTENNEFEEQVSALTDLLSEMPEDEKEILERLSELTALEDENMELKQRLLQYDMWGVY